MLARQLGQIAAVFLERVVGILGRIAGDARSAAHGGQRLEEAVLRQVKALHDLLHCAVRRGEQTHHQVLHGDVLIVHALRLGGGLAQRLIHLGGHIHLALLTGGAAYAGQLFHRGHSGAVHGGGVQLHFAQQLIDQVVGAVGQRGQQVRLGQLLIAILAGQGLRSVDGGDAFLCILIILHNAFILSSRNQEDQKFD